MNINYDYYRVFYYVARYRNITLAANAMLYNQPNVTRTIKKLESELGCTLFVRSNRGVTLTPEGEKLYEHIKIAVAQIELAEEELSSARSLQYGLVSIGVTEVALRTFLLPVLNEYRKRYPSIRLNISNFTTSQAISSLKSGLVDIAVVTTPMGDIRGLRSRTLKTFRELAVCGESFAALSERELSLRELTEYPIVSLGSQAKSYELYQNWFAENNLAFEPVVELATADQILPVVKNNLGIGFVPESFLEDESGGKIYRLRLKERTPERSVVLLRREDGSLSIAANQIYDLIFAQQVGDE